MKSKWNSFQVKLCPPFEAYIFQRTKKIDVITIISVSVESTISKLSLIWFGMLVLLLCFLCIIPFFVFSSDVYLKYEVLSDSCEITGLSYYLPLNSESEDLFSTCTVFFTSDSYSVQFSFSSSSQIFSMSMYRNDLNCSNGHPIYKDDINLGECHISGSRKLFNHSKFTVHEEEPVFLKSQLENENDLFVTKYFSGPKCTEKYYIEHEIVRTNKKIGLRNITIKCNDTYSILSAEENIIAVRDFRIAKCLWEESSNYTAVFSCKDSDFLESFKSSCLTETEYFTVTDYGKENQCKGNNILQQMTIRNGFCFPVNEFEYGVFSDLFRNIELKYKILIPYESSARQFYGHNLFSAEVGKKKDSRILIGELFENFDCSSESVISKIFVPGCVTVNDASEFFSPTDFGDDWMFSSPGRIAVIPISSCEGLGENEVEEIVEKAVEEMDFQIVSSLTAGACCNSEFDFYTFGDDESSFYGMCEYDQKSGNLVSSFKRTVDSTICNSWKESKTHKGFLCLDRINYNNQSALYTCVQNYYNCYGVDRLASGVCSSHGSCVSQDDCACLPLWYGIKCKNTVIIWFVLGGVFLLFCCCSVVTICLLCLCICLLLVLSACRKKKDVLAHSTVNEMYPLLQESGSAHYIGKRNPHLLLRSKTPILSSLGDQTEEFEGDPDGLGRVFQVFQNSRHLIFRGNFKDGKSNGSGTEFFLPLPSENLKKSTNRRPPRRIKFEGQYKNGKRSGPGCLHSILPDEMELRGVWQNGEIISIERDYVDLPKIKISDFQFDYSTDLIGIGSEGDIFRVVFEGKEAALKILRIVGDSSSSRGSSKNNSSTTSYSSRNSSNFQKTANLDLDIRNKILWSNKQQKFIRSQKLWSKVSHHPFILDLFAWTGIDSEKMGYVTEKCEMSLRDAILQECLDWDDKIRILYEISVAMEFLHSHSIMHRDLKVGNVLLDEYSHTAKICDFEFSRFDERDWKNNQSDLSVLGTPVYIAPEIVRGEIYSKMCDVFSFGILVHCVIFGVVSPYSGIEECSCGTKLHGKGIVFIPQHVDECGLRPPTREGVIDEEKGKWIVDELIEPCLNELSSERPKFSEIMELFKKNKVRKGGGNDGEDERDFNSEGERNMFLADDDSLSIN